MLLYHYMSIVAVKAENMNDFLEIRDRYLTEETDHMLRANVQMLMVYLFLKFNNLESAATELCMLENVFIREESPLGEAIAKYFLAYVFKALKRVILFSHKSFIERCSGLSF